jgi:filamentous hemagglutinin family protein
MTRRISQALWRTFALAFAGWNWNGFANPSGLTVISGSASAQSSGAHLNITAGNDAVLHWNSFNIGKGQTTSFLQPSADSIVLNTIGGASPSQIWGHLTANGTVILANAYGFYFGPHSMIKVGGDFIATTAPLPPDFGAGASWQFTVPPPAASIVNYGEIQAGEGHSLFLISEQIDNHGKLSAPGGNVGLYAGKEVLVSERADGRGLTAAVTLPEGSIDNTGSIVASGASIALQEQVVNKSDITPAVTARTENGAVELVAADITLGSSASGGAMNVNTAFAGDAAISLQASDSITLNANTTWNLSASTGQTTGQLTLQAGNNIVFNNNSQITDANNWSVSLQAGANIFLNGGSGKNFNGTIQTGAGDISLTAGQSILVGGGAVRTTGGGNISLQATAGDIDAGSANGNYQFSIAGYAPSATLGQITTAAGGNVTLQAGNDIISSPTVPSGQTPGASGAYGPEPGNVTITAGNSVFGDFVVANGTGTINAANIGSSASTIHAAGSGDTTSVPGPVSLSLIDGSWNVTAADDVYLAEIRNPNGAFNASSLAVPTGEYSGNPGATVPNRSAFLFDYADDDAANISAGDGITLVGANLPRSVDNQQMPPIYPPILSLEAGAGGVTLDNSIILFPSAQGALNITTHHGGDLTGVTQQTTLTGIIMSDSGLPGWAAFAQGQAATPLHLHDPNPVTLDIAGDIDSFGLTAPTYADVTVAGDTYNFGFQGVNFSASQATDINVAGAITYRGDLTSVALAAPLPPALFNLAVSGDAEAVKKITYDAATQTLTYIGQMSAAEKAFLLNPYRTVVNPTTGAIKNIPIVLTAAQQAAVQQLFTASQTASLGDQGLALAGPGQFNITAHSVDLGISGGISVLAPNAAEAAISTRGADLNINVADGFEMTASKIANESYLGSIQLTVGGSLNVGGQLSAFGDPNSPKGIFTTSGGGVSITATGDVNVDGSRIAAYNGGDITVKSLEGDVNAGSGGAGSVTMQSLELNKAGKLVAIAASIPGSGILATTLGDSTAQLGDIDISTPEGSVNASSGGIIQLALNDRDANSSINVTAGKDITATDSGIIGSTINLHAGHNITGLVIASHNLNITAVQNVNVTAVSGGNAVIGGATVSGIVISGGGLDASGDITASLVGENVTASGNTSGASVGIPASTAAHDTAQAAEDADTALSKIRSVPSDDDDDKKRKKGITLAQKSQRVTVLLAPAKN